MMKRLQLRLLDSEGSPTNRWIYVFCTNDHNIVTTKSKHKALRQQDLEYFQFNYPDREFRTSEWLSDI